MSIHPTLSVTLILTLMPFNAWAGMGSGGSGGSGTSKGDTPFVETLDMEGIHHETYVSNGWDGSVAGSDQDGLVINAIHLLENAQHVASIGKNTRAEHESYIHSERTSESDGACMTWSTQLTLDGGYDMPHPEGCGLDFTIGSGPVAVCREVAQYSAVATTGWVDLYGPNTHWGGALGNISEVPASYTDGLAYVYEIELDAGDTITVSTTVTHQGYVDDPDARLGGNTYHGYSNIKVTTPYAFMVLSASANQGEAGVFSETDEDTEQYTASYSGTHRFEVEFDDRLHVSGKNWRSDRRANESGEYYVESKAEVSFCP